MIRLASIAVFSAAVLVAGAAISLTGAEASPSDRTPVYRIGDYPFPTAPALLQWQSVLGRNAAQQARYKGEDCSEGEPKLDCAAKEMARIEDKLRDLPPQDQVAAVYSYFNAVKYKAHKSNCGPDCWATRLDFIVKREGDCGDHALAEYFTLRRLGFAERDLQLIIAQLPGYEDSFKGGHVVLRVRVGDEYSILDNRRNELVGLEGLRKYKVLAGLNADSVQIYNLITPVPPPGFVGDAEQVAALIVSPGVAVAPTPEPEEPASAPVAVASNAPAAEQQATVQPAAVQVAAVQADSETASEEAGDEACVQSATLADWNPNLPCVPRMKIVVVAKNTDLTAPAKPAAQPAAQPATTAQAEPQPPAPKAAEAKAPEPALVDVPAAVPEPVVAEKAPQPAKAVEIAKADAPKGSPAEATKVEQAPAADQAEADDDSCVQTASSLSDWSANQPCITGAKAFRMEIKAKTIITSAAAE